MQDLRKNKRKMINKPMSTRNNNIKEEMGEGLERAYRPKHNNTNDCCNNTCNNDCCNNTNDCCNNTCHNDCCSNINDCCNNTCNNDCNHHHDNCKCDHHHDNCKCEPCEAQSDICIDNPCKETCCNPITPPRFSTNNSVPVAIETNRVFDSIVFKTFTDAIAPQTTYTDSNSLLFDIDVVEVCGPVPRTGPVNVKIDKVCMNFSEIEIESEDPMLEDFNVARISPKNNGICENTFEYLVCGEPSPTCCKQGKGQSVAYKQKGLVVTVRDLVLELRGRCGCTEIIALAYPAVRTSTGSLNRIGEVQFPYNTLASSLCLPASGRTVTLRQEYDVNLSVDCIGKALLSVVDNSGCECVFDLDIPNGIDVILCLQEVVSILRSEQMVVLASPTAIQPRVVDTFANVCDFSQCGEKKHGDKDSCNTCNR